MDLLADLDARGLVHDSTDRAALQRRLSEGPITIYVGFDPTADSLHVGNMIGLMTLRRFQDAGHRPISLAGGATGMIGDPSGKSDERNLLDDDALAANLEGIRPQLRQFLDFEAPDNPARLLDNRAWTVGVGVLDFLRDVGKHVTVNHMVAKESVRARMAGTEGISYTEFSYMLLQAHDFAWLFENEGCEMQAGGSDQWGNITLGVDLVRRRTGRHAHALTWPLLLRSDGSKYGKTAGGATMWLGAHRMSPYAFYQGWMQAPDDDVLKLLLQLTLLPVDECHGVASAHDAAPDRRDGQRRLAHEITALVHGEAAARGAAEASGVLFAADFDPRDVSRDAVDMLGAELGVAAVEGSEVSVADAAVGAGFLKSKSEVRRAVQEGSLHVNGERVADADLSVGSFAPLPGRHLLLRRGRKRHTLLRVGS